jgi:hypothetical protein
MLRKNKACEIELVDFLIQSTGIFWEGFFVALHKLLSRPQLQGLSCKLANLADLAAGKLSMAKVYSERHTVKLVSCVGSRPDDTGSTDYVR